MRALNVIGWIAAVVLLLIIIAGGALFFGGGRAVAWALEHPVSTMIGRQITVGRLSLQWANPSRLIAQDIHVANAAWGSEPDMFSARRLEIELYPRTLLRGPTRIPLVSLDGAKLLLETSKQGEKNWDFGGAKSTTDRKSVV